MEALKTKQIWVQITGGERNVILLTPPLCFTRDNSQALVRAIREILTEMRLKPSHDNNPTLNNYINIKEITEDLTEKVSDDDGHDSLCDMD